MLIRPPPRAERLPVPPWGAVSTLPTHLLFAARLLPVFHIFIVFVDGRAIQPEPFSLYGLLAEGVSAWTLNANGYELHCAQKLAFRTEP